MRRRTGRIANFISSFAAIQLAFVIAIFVLIDPAKAQPQTPGGPTRIALLMTGSATATAAHRDSFKRGLFDLGLVEGLHYAIEERFADGIASKLPELAAELVQAQPAVLVTSSTASTIAAHNATRTIPIVSALMGNAVAIGLIDSQSRPGGNVTGMVVADVDLAAKQFDLARELVPSAGRLGILLNPKNSGTEVQRKGAETAANKLSVDLVVAEVSDANEIESAFQEFARKGATAVFVIGDGLFFSQRERIARVALSAGLATMFIFRDHVQAGGLMSYGVDLKDNYRRAASYVQRILMGARPSDLPAETPTKFELVLNLKTARSLGIVISTNLLARADEVIE